MDWSLAVLFAVCVSSWIIFYQGVADFAIIGIQYWFKSLSLLALLLEKSYWDLTWQPLLHYVSTA